MYLTILYDPPPTKVHLRAYLIANFWEISCRSFFEAWWGLNAASYHITDIFWLCLSSETSWFSSNVALYLLTESQSLGEANKEVCLSSSWKVNLLRNEVSQRAFVRLWMSVGDSLLQALSQISQREHDKRRQRKN